MSYTPITFTYGQQFTSAEAQTLADNDASFHDGSGVLPLINGWTPANETWSYSSADSPTFVITVPSDATTKYSVGMKIQLTQSATVKYFIITAVTSTTLTVYGGTDYTLANSTISANSFSAFESPYGFPRNSDKWSVTVTDGTQRSQSSPVSNTYYNMGTTNTQIVLPIGAWNLEYTVLMVSQTAGTNSDLFFGVICSLSTSNSSVSDARFNCAINVEQYAVSGANPMQSQQSTQCWPVAVASKTTYYMIAKNNGSSNVPSSIRFENGTSAMYIRATSAYL